MDQVVRLHSPGLIPLSSPVRSQKARTHPDVANQGEIPMTTFAQEEHENGTGMVLGADSTDEAEPTHHDMVAWENLTETTRAQNLAPLRHLADVLDDAGCQLRSLTKG